MDEDTKKVVIDYIKEQRINSAGTKKIKEFCATQPPVSKTVFRGHKRSREIRFNANWYSATELVKVAREEFASADCCVFTIHLVDIPIIDVNKFVGEEIGHYKEEQEIIFLGGGAFYQDKKGHERGFIEKAAGEFETVTFPIFCAACRFCQWKSAGLGAKMMHWVGVKIKPS